MLADHVEFVVGVDTHKHGHTAALVAANGGQLGSLEVAATAGEPVGAPDARAA